MRIEVNAAKCIASGQCVLNAPGVFDQREDEGTVLLLDDSPAPENHDRVREAALVCPSGAITLKELRCACSHSGRFARSTTCSGRPAPPTFRPSDYRLIDRLTGRNALLE